MDKVLEAIDEKRNIKPNSLRAYGISLRKVQEAVEPDKEFTNLDFLKDENKVQESISGFKISTQKNYLASIIVGLDALNENDKYKDDLESYRSYLEAIAEEHNKEQKSGEKSESQTKNWTTIKELQKVLTGYKNDINERELWNKETLTTKQYDLMQKWVIGNLYVGDPDNPPARADYAPMFVVSEKEFNDLHEDDKDLNNYLVVKSRNNKFFHFGEYKTAKKYGANKVILGKKLNSVMNIWLRFNKTDSLLTNSKREPQTANGLSKYINKVFAPTGKKISINILRHVFISEKFPNINDEKAQIAKKMGHSISQQGDYSKK
tara:strand:- start:39 stop:998 length:960 start_codon:yes stop_codon:yes gene_type:complete